MKSLLLPLIIFISITIFSQESVKKNDFLNKSKVIHKNYDLNNTLNLIDADITPVYKGCEDKKSNLDKVNCLNTNLTIDITKKFIASNALKKSKLKRGTKKIRVVFIIDENGCIKIKNISGKWPSIIVDELENAVKSIPNLQPAIHLEKKSPVKYSIQLYFTI